MLGRVDGFRLESPRESPIQALLRSDDPLPPGPEPGGRAKHSLWIPVEPAGTHLSSRALF